MISWHFFKERPEIFVRKSIHLLEAVLHGQVGETRSIIYSEGKGKDRPQVWESGLRWLLTIYIYTI